MGGGHAFFVAADALTFLEGVPGASLFFAVGTVWVDLRVLLGVGVVQSVGDAEVGVHPDHVRTLGLPTLPARPKQVFPFTVAVGVAGPGEDDVLEEEPDGFGGFLLAGGGGSPGDAAAVVTSAEVPSGELESRDAMRVDGLKFFAFFDDESADEVGVVGRGGDRGPGGGGPGDGSGRTTSGVPSPIPSRAAIRVRFRAAS